jgi:hypothetical protein
VYVCLGVCACVFVLARASKEQVQLVEIAETDVQLQMLEAVRDILHANPENINTFCKINALQRLLQLAAPLPVPSLPRLPLDPAPPGPPLVSSYLAPHHAPRCPASLYQRSRCRHVEMPPRVLARTLVRSTSQGERALYLAALLPHLLSSPRPPVQTPWTRKSRVACSA